MSLVLLNERLDVPDEEEKKPNKTINEKLKKIMKVCKNFNEASTSNCLLLLKTTRPELKTQQGIQHA